MAHDQTCLLVYKGGAVLRKKHGGAAHLPWKKVQWPGACWGRVSLRVLKGVHLPNVQMRHRAGSQRPQKARLVLCR
jgi:hypothetical protein